MDDFLATGTTGVALHKIIQQAGAAAAGMAFLVEKRFQDGRGAAQKIRNSILLEMHWSANIFNTLNSARDLLRFLTQNELHQYDSIIIQYDSAI